MTVPKAPEFHYYPRKWGFQVHHSGRMVLLKDGDLEMLDKLREHFKEQSGEILSWKFDLKPIVGELPGLIHALHRLWANGLVVRFSTQFHTVHGNPEYINWLIWEEQDGQFNAEWNDPRTPSYIMS